LVTRAATELNTVAGAKINMDKIALKLDVATGKSFVPDSQRWKNIEDVTKNINYHQFHRLQHLQIDYLNDEGLNPT
jgi:uncharacterized lipoprotein YehR (DUF1307 family)